MHFSYSHCNIKLLKSMQNKQKGKRLQNKKLKE